MSHDSELWQLIPQLAGKRVLIFGDIMLDRFVACAMERISPEAPVPVLRHDSEQHMLGGAGNVAANIRALGATPMMIGLIGGDAEGEIIRGICARSGIADRWLVTSAGRSTSLKTRFVAKGQQVVRYDREEIAPNTPLEQSALRAAFDAAIGEADIVVLSDYAKGTLLNGFSETLIRRSKAHGLRVIVDPKGRDYARYHGASVIKPNLKELVEATGIDGSRESELVAASAKLVEALELDALVVSRGAAGISVIADDGVAHIPTVAREVFDEAGAGDTVVGVLALALAANLTVEVSARLANAAAGVVVGKRGTAQVSQSELIHALRGSRQGGIVAAALVGPLAESWRAQGQKVGFTNGCFDILHAGHVALLEQAKKCCDRLVVGLNSDDSVRRLKGTTRPINAEMARARVLAAMSAVDAVVIFDDDTPIALIESLVPEILIKGTDYALKDVVGADFVLAHGGVVELIPLVPGLSSSNIIASIGQGKPEAPSG